MNLKLILKLCSAFALSLLLFGFILFSLHKPTSTAFAQSEPTPVPTRAFDWKGTGLTNLPLGLPGTLAIAPGGGGTSLFLCEGIITQNNQTVYSIWPRNGSVFVGRPHIRNEIIVAGCHSDGSEQVFIASLGNEPEIFVPTNVGPDHVSGCLDCVLFEFDLPLDAAPDDYLLYINTETDQHTKALTFFEYPTLYLVIKNAITGKLVDTETSVMPQDILLVDYRGISSQSTIAVSLYKDNTIVHFWEITANEDGNFIEALIVPRDTPSGTYDLIACQPSNCHFQLDPHSISHENIIPPPVGWGRFYVLAAENEGSTAIVDPVIAWNGLRMLTSPNGNRIGGLPAGRSLTILSPSSVDDNGVQWTEVEDNVTNKRGWVKDRYLLHDTIENSYVNLNWAPGCDVERIEVELLIDDQRPCDPNAESLSLDEFADDLRLLGMLRANEWLVASTPRNVRNEAILIRTSSNARVGWLRIGRTIPLVGGRSPMGAVWRTPYTSNRFDTTKGVCWLRRNREWMCEVK